MKRNNKKDHVRDNKKIVSDNLLNTREAADYLGIKKKRLENLRSHKMGPRFIKTDRVCFYSKQDLNNWKKSRESGKKKKLLFVNSPKSIKSARVNKSRKIAKKRNVESTKLDALSKESKIKTDIGYLKTNIYQIKALIDSKKGFLVNETDVAIFKNIASILISLVTEIKELKERMQKIL